LRWPARERTRQMVPAKVARRAFRWSARYHRLKLAARHPALVSGGAAGLLIST
jgi:hypothetical protein